MTLPKQLPRGYYPKAAALGVLLGLAALTKLSGLVLWPVAALAVAGGAGRARDWRRFVWGGLIIAGLALAVCGWWYWRNQQLYGEWLGLDTMVAIAGPRRPPPGLWPLVREEWVGFYLSYWGVFGVFTILASGWVYTFFSVLTVTAAGGGLRQVGQGLRLRRWTLWPERMLLAVFSLLTLVGVVRWTMTTLASQGRLLFGAIAPLSIFMASGLLAAGGDWLRTRLGRGRLGLLLAALALVAGFAAVHDIAPRYRPPPALGEADLPADMQPVHARFGEVAELVGYRADGRPRLPGQTQQVTLYWRALEATEQDYALALHLLGREAAEVGKLDTWTGGGLAPTSQWQAGEIIADEYSLPVSSTVEAPALLFLDLYFWLTDSPGRVPITTPDGTRLESVTLRVGRVVPAEAPRPAPAVPVRARFEHGIELLGLDNGAVPGDALALTLYWQTSQPVPGDYTVFVHLVDEQGIQVLGADSPPLNGDWPTSAWEPRQAFADVRLIPLPPQLPPGCCDLRLGLYEPLGGARLEAYRPDGSRWPDDAVVFERVIAFP